MYLIPPWKIVERRLPDDYVIFGESRPLLENLRRRVLALGDDIVEDIRMHRIVYGRKTIMRNFLDVRPSNNGLRITIRKGKSFQDPMKIGIDKGFVAEVSVNESNLEDALNLIRQSYLSV
jgi:predicted transport protein